MKKKKATISWSGGKDSALALFKILQSDEFEVASLHTTFDQKLKRVGLHGISEILIEQQAASVGLPLEKIYIPQDSNHNSYEEALGKFCKQQKEQGIEVIVFGDIFLQDLKEYREKQLKSVGIEAVFPLWGIPTLTLVKEFVALNFQTLICCINAQILPKEFLGETINKLLIEAIRQKADPCGENGEFHTFVYNGPLFKLPVSFRKGPQVLKTYDLRKEVDGNIVEEKIGYWFQELFPSETVFVYS